MISRWRMIKMSTPVKISTTNSMNSEDVNLLKDQIEELTIIAKEHAQDSKNYDYENTQLKEQVTILKDRIKVLQDNNGTLKRLMNFDGLDINKARDLYNDINDKIQRIINLEGQVTKLKNLLSSKKNHRCKKGDHYAHSNDEPAGECEYWCDYCGCTYDWKLSIPPGITVGETKSNSQICPGCGFPTDMKRHPVIIDNNPLSIVCYEEDKCDVCGHQKSGWNIDPVYKHFQEVSRKFNDKIRVFEQTLEQTRIERNKRIEENLQYLKTIGNLEHDRNKCKNRIKDLERANEEMIRRINEQHYFKIINTYWIPKVSGLSAENKVLKQKLHKLAQDTNRIWMGENIGYAPTPGPLNPTLFEQIISIIQDEEQNMPNHETYGTVKEELISRLKDKFSRWTDEKPAPQSINPTLASNEDGKGKVTLEIFYGRHGVDLLDYKYEMSERLERRNWMFLLGQTMCDIVNQEQEEQEEEQEDPSEINLTLGNDQPSFMDLPIKKVGDTFTFLGNEYIVTKRAMIEPTNNQEVIYYVNKNCETWSVGDCLNARMLMINLSDKNEELKAQVEDLNEKYLHTAEALKTRDGIFEKISQEEDKRIKELEQELKTFALFKQLLTTPEGRHTLFLEMNPPYVVEQDIHNIALFILQFFNQAHNKLNNEPITNLPTEHPEGLTEKCPSCGKFINPEICWCGEGVHDGHEGHGFVPYGCTCNFSKSSKYNDKGDQE